MNNYGKITALYSRLSVDDEDRDGGESNSIQKRKGCPNRRLFSFPIRFAYPDHQGAGSIFP